MIMPASIPHANSNRSETVLFLLDITVFYPSPEVAYRPLGPTHHHLFPPVVAVVHRVFPQFEIFQINTGSLRDGIQWVIHVVYRQPGRI